MLSAYARLVMVGPGKEIHARVVRCGFEFDVKVSSALIDMYAKCGFPYLSLQIFERMIQRNAISYNSIIMGLGSHGFGQQVIEIFDDMLQKGLQPDQSTFSALLSAWGHVETHAVLLGNIIFDVCIIEFSRISVLLVSVQTQPPKLEIP
ncbi:hypothetical protein ACLOJK_037378 [Asimina triloba]